MKKKILLIDDDEDLLRSFQVNLEIFGYVVTTAHDSKEGLIMLEKDKPDLIVLDVMMNTETEGYNFLQQIKSISVYEKLPILILSAIHDIHGTDLSVNENQKNQPEVRYQEKPVAPLFLVELIEDMLKE